VPLIYIHAGQVLFSTAKWGIDSTSLGTTETFRKAARRTLDCPAMIPASYVDLAIPGNSEGEGSVVRLLPQNDRGKLYLACVFRRDQMYRADSVSLLILSVSFLALAVILDGAWALLAGRLRSVLGARGILRNRLQGGLLISAAAGLALACKS
jgi:hypothetical protein